MRVKSGALINYEEQGTGMSQNPAMAGLDSLPQRIAGIRCARQQKWGGPAGSALFIPAPPPTRVERAPNFFQFQDGLNFNNPRKYVVQRSAMVNLGATIAGSLGAAFSITEIPPLKTGRSTFTKMRAELGNLWSSVECEESKIFNLTHP